MATTSGRSRKTATQPSPRRGSRVRCRQVRIDGRVVAFRERGAGRGRPVVVLLHGLAGNCASWEPVMRALPANVHVIAPDMVGHGESDKPITGDYSPGAYACGVRDLLLLLGVEQATLVGHSLGGGVAMQFAYQFPELTQRLVLVASGGLGPDVALGLRLASLPGAQIVLQVSNQLTPRWVAALAHRVGAGLGLAPRADLDALAQGLQGLADGGARQAFLHTVRAGMNLAGQRIDATERLHLLSGAPVLFVVGDGDTTIPAQHTYQAHEQLPDSRLEVFDGAGHHPHVEEPERFAGLLEEFLQVAPAPTDRAAVRRRLTAATRTA